MTDHSQKTILFVDDDGIGMLPLVDILEAHGYSVVWKRNATDALHVLQSQQKEKIDVILLDVMMPLGQDISHPEGGRWAGSALLRRLEEIKEAEDIPVVVLTIVTDPKILQEINALNVRLLQKSEPVSAVLDELRNAVNNSELIREMRRRSAGSA